jgi:lipopolysaccharide transport system permease protein
MSSAADTLASESREPIVIEPRKGWAPLQLRGMWGYRELLYFLTLRELQLRYKQTAIGVAWAVIQPLFTMVIFSLFFGRLAKMPSDGIPYSVFALAGLVPWTFFANGLTQASNSLVSSSNLITKVYFPRLVVPLASILSGVVDFLVGMVLLVIFMLFKGFTPSWTLVFFPIFLLLAFTTALGVGLWLAALNVEYRDVRYVVPFMTQIWLFATPIAYPSSLLHEPWRTVYGLNPMVGVVEGFRWSILGVGNPPGSMLWVSAATSLLFLVSGAAYFRRMERSFADIL